MPGPLWIQGYPALMRALPGRASRTSLADPAAVTREGVKRDQRRRILRATGELVAKRGYNAVTVELIIKRARVSFKTFYVHFPNKEALLPRALRLGHGRLAGGDRGGALR